MTRTSEQEAVWQAVRERIGRCACEPCENWRFEGTDEVHCIQGDKLCEAALSVADAILSLDEIEVRDKEDDKGGIAYVAFKNGDYDSKSNFVRVVPKK